MLVRRAAKAKARRARGIYRMDGPSFDPRVHALQNPSLATLAKLQQQCDGAAEKRSYTKHQQKLLLSWGGREFVLLGKTFVLECARHPPPGTPDPRGRQLLPSKP